MPDSPRRLLLFAYDFPPALVGVRRTVKFVRYLREFGWRCAVITVKPVAGAGWDTAALREVAGARPLIRRAGSLDPYRLRMIAQGLAWPLMRRVYQGPGGPGGAAAKDGGGSGAGNWGVSREWQRRLMTFLRRALFVPDDRVGWLPFALVRGLSAARRWKPDALYSTSYPHTAHLAAGLTRALTGIPWLADFRDGWTQNPSFFDPLTPLHAAAQRALERWTARRADRLLTVSPPITEHLQRLRGPGKAPAETLYNGFDDSDFPASAAGAAARLEDSEWNDPDCFRLLYTGAFFGTRTPETLFRAVALAAARRPDLARRLRVFLFTSLEDRWLALRRELGVESLTPLRGFVPYREALALQRAAAILVLVTDTGPGSEIMVTQKVFEYLASGRPIWALTGRGACRDLLGETGGAILSPVHDAQAASRDLERIFDAWREGRLAGADPARLAPFHRREQTRRLAAILDSMTLSDSGSRSPVQESPL